MEMAIPEFYAKVKDALASDPVFVAAMLEDLDSALASRFGVALPQPSRLALDGDGYALTVGGRTYTVIDPRKAEPGELDDAELELVSGGKDPPAPAQTSSPPPPTGDTTLGVHTVSPGLSTYIHEGSTSLVNR